MTIGNHSGRLYGRINKIADNPYAQTPNQPEKPVHPVAPHKDTQHYQPIQQYHPQPAPSLQQLQGQPTPSPIYQDMPTQLPVHTMSGKMGFPPEPPKQASKGNAKWWWIGGVAILFVLYSMGNSTANKFDSLTSGEQAANTNPVTIDPSIEISDKAFAEISDIMNYANEVVSPSLKIASVERVWETVENEQALKTLGARVEPMVLRLVSAIPATDYSNNRDGYRLLVQINAHSDTPKPEYAQKAKIYADKLNVQKRKERTAAIARTTKGLTKKYDKVSGHTLYKHPYSPKYVNTRSTVYLTMGKIRGGEYPLLLTTSYTASNWLFVREVQVYVDGVTYGLTSGKFERGNNSSIWEWKTEEASYVQMTVLREMAHGKEVIIAYTGTNFRKDKTMSGRDKLALRKMLDAYDAVNG